MFNVQRGRESVTGTFSLQKLLGLLRQSYWMSLLVACGKGDVVAAPTYACFNCGHQ
ncbi:uncharacterized protein BJ212DRAFT_1385641 [Suillus subaureus]|uniref:Uncharacterized protein n=1 Tax=Suillus subaureus TaxID=48587 RepID=A0A9P7J881_9AGAM|nr:uncharacterized protein BJ212DRAFT_1385641 [Suillus subaureus]KAG1807818.1 hypothetical protein BJ212DRAFT_1385641 [Suillus subaureus]